MAKRVVMEKHLECHDYGKHSILMNTAHSGHLRRGGHATPPPLRCLTRIRKTHRSVLRTSSRESCRSGHPDRAIREQMDRQQHDPDQE
jgi:hypothetical protein